MLEGVAFAFRDCLEALKAAGTRIERATAVGGGSKSRLWLKIIATVLGIPIDVPAGGDFGAAFGAARLGLVAATGEPPRASASLAGQWPPPSLPATDAAAAYEDAYRALCPALSRLERGHVAHEQVFSAHRSHPLRGAREPQRPRLQALRCGARRSWARRWPSICGSPSCYWHSFCWTRHRSVRRRDFPARLAGPGRPDGACTAQGRGGVRDVPAARRPVLHLSRPRHRSRRRNARAVQSQRVGDRPAHRKADASHGRRAAVGHRQHVLATGATWRVRPPIPIPTCSPMPRPR